MYGMPNAPYYNGYVAPNYNPYQQGQQMSNSFQNASQQATSLVGSVNGVNGAKAYIIPPNCTAFLWDNDDQTTLYVKSSNNSGQASVTKFNKATAETQKTAPATAPKPAPEVDFSKWVKIDDFNALKEEVEKLKMIKPIVSRGGND